MRWIQIYLIHLHMALLIDQLQLTSEDFFHQMIEEAKTLIRIKENGC